MATFIYYDLCKIFHENNNNREEEEEEEKINVSYCFYYNNQIEAIGWYFCVMFQNMRFDFHHSIMAKREHKSRLASGMGGMEIGRQKKKKIKRIKCSTSVWST